METCNTTEAIRPVEGIFNLIHEIGTPVNGIISASRFLKDAIDSNDFASIPSIMSIIKAAEENLLDIFLRAKMCILENTDEYLFVQKDFNPGSVVQKVLKSLEALMLTKSITCNTSLSADFPTTTKGDPTYLTQIMNNLISNAINYSPKGSKLSVAGFTMENAKLYCIALTDEGPGIPKEKQITIFDKYKRNTIEEMNLGNMGLGLHTVKQLINLMGGCIKLDSTIRKGSRFTITLPIKNA
ncbi:histidine kinase/DNA gyrase B/HSP90-like ATPase [Chitinophaga niastensis]|uniref:histidine kinase n=1 Tax=Chitinophaga niastensis TaxID=536980 RepID=A0A2P8HUU2_CHINA|nr:HAMP domain-containing sensor histidine kinase [Chitinophaga niastensis]PSL50000.1 histidine kinase/DNA gyrase B/HSP90-like ATPase [Chitinophaga niastensis]